MLDLFGSDEWSLGGWTSLLDLDKVPWQRAQLDSDDRWAHGDRLPVFVGDLSPEQLDGLTGFADAGRRALVVSADPAVAGALLGLRAERRISALDWQPCEGLWPSDVTLACRELGDASLRLPQVGACVVSPRGEAVATQVFPSAGGGAPVSVLAWAHLVEDEGRRERIPVVINKNSVTWVMVDLGRAFASLLEEGHLSTEPLASRPSLSRVVMRRLSRTMTELGYYLLPAPARRLAQRLAYRHLERELENRRHSSSRYPFDPTGWLLSELCLALLTRNLPLLPRLGRWPAPFASAACLTHDIEPRTYAYGPGLDRLLQATRLDSSAPTFGLVARRAATSLSDEQVRALAPYGILCHGLTHEGEPVQGIAQVASSLRQARVLLEQRLGRAVEAYRSPRLERSADLLAALDESGFELDSSFPDVDRENLHRYGAGVRLNLPYRPLLADAGRGVRRSRCLELPLTAPDCVQPMYGGATRTELLRTLDVKTRWVRRSSGLYVALVHGGVFGKRDSELRSWLRSEILARLQHRDVWLARFDEIANWWRRRESLRIEASRGGRYRVTNLGSSEVVGMRLIADTCEGGMLRSCRFSVVLPTLSPGASVAVSFPTGELMEESGASAEP